MPTAKTEKPTLEQASTHRWFEKIEAQGFYSSIYGMLVGFSLLTVPKLYQNLQKTT